MNVIQLHALLDKLIEEGKGERPVVLDAYDMDGDPYDMHEVGAVTEETTGRWSMFVPAATRVVKLVP